MTTNKYIRQYDMIAPELLATPIHIIGAGGIGSWSTLALAKMGCTNIISQDMDTVSIENTASQIYGDVDIGKPKPEALREIVTPLTSIQISTNCEPWKPSQKIKCPIIISALDNMDTRAKLWQSLKLNPVARWYIDGRMAGDLIRIYCIDMTKPETWSKYEKTIVTRANIEPVPCTGKAVVYNVFICAGVITNLVKKIAKNEDTKPETIIDLITLAII